MAFTDNSRQRATIIGRTWFCTGTALVVMGMVAIAAELVLQQQLHRSKCDDCIFQSLNVKAGFWCGIPVSSSVYYDTFSVQLAVPYKDRNRK